MTSNHKPVVIVNQTRPGYERANLGKSEFTRRAVFPNQTAAKLVVQLAQSGAQQNQGSLQCLDRIATMAQVRILCANSDDLKWTLIAGVAMAGLRFADKDTYRTFISMLVDQVKHAGGNNLPDTFKLHQFLWFSRKPNLGRLQTSATLGRKLFYRRATDRVGIIYASAVTYRRRHSSILT